MLYAPVSGGLSVRAESDGSRTISGSFPYNSLATLSDGGRSGRPRKEKFAPHAFAHNVNDESVEINLLAGHSFDRPLASKLQGSLKLDDTDSALNFTARIVPEVLAVSYVKDTLALIESGLAVGLSPGFRIPPERAVPNAEKVEQEDPDQGNALIRTIFQALLFELSIVTRPAYKETEVEARSWEPTRQIYKPRPRIWAYR